MSRPPVTIVVGRGLHDVMQERIRQVTEEGWSAEHDDQHIRGELGAAAACYAVPSRLRDACVQYFWPITWDRKWWKPAGAHDDLSARRRDLVRAGALIIAEIDRITRAEGPMPHPQDGSGRDLEELDGVKADLLSVSLRDGDILCRAALRHIEALEAERDDYASQIAELLPAVNREAVEQRARADALEAENARLREMAMRSGK